MRQSAPGCTKHTAMGYDAVRCSGLCVRRTLGAVPLRARLCLDAWYVRTALSRNLGRQRFFGPRLFNLLNPVDSVAAAVRVLMGRKYRRLPCCGTLQGQPFRFATCSHCRKRLGFMGFAVAKAASRGAQMSSGRRNEGLCTCFRTSLFRA